MKALTDRSGAAYTEDMVGRELLWREEVEIRTKMRTLYVPHSSMTHQRLGPSCNRDLKEYKPVVQKLSEIVEALRSKVRRISRSGNQ
jgi:hypothetical protein